MLEQARPKMLSILLDQLQFYVRHAPHMCTEDSTHVFINTEFLRMNAPAAKKIVMCYATLGHTEESAYDDLCREFPTAVSLRDGVRLAFPKRASE